MCHYCHKLRHTPEAAQHRSENCTDENNTFSKLYVKTSNQYCRSCNRTSSMCSCMKKARGSRRLGIDIDPDFNTY